MAPSYPIIEQKDSHLQVSFNENKKNVYHYVWLRDNCLCPKCTQDYSLQKLHSSSTIPLDISPASYTASDSELAIQWNDDHKSTFPIQWLHDNAYDDNAVSKRRQQVKPTLWQADEIIEATHFISFDTFMNDDVAFHKALKLYLDYGILILNGVPSSTESVELIAKRIGPIRETFFGVSWDVKNIPKAHNIAYTSVDLGLHQDLSYFEAVPSVQFLHFITPAEHGGESIFVDSYSAAEKLMLDHPDDFDTLLRVPMTFQYTNNGHYFKVKKPVLYRNENLYIGVNYSPQNHGPMNVAPADIVPFYKAFKQFSEYINLPALTYTRKMKAGECAIFDNRRVLHARTSFNSAEHRHLRGAYLGMDEVEDRYNTLGAKLGLKPYRY